MYLVSSGVSFKPTSSSSASSSTQFSQDWARRKVVVKHSIKSNLLRTLCTYSIQQLHALCDGTNSRQRVLTRCNEYLLYTTSTYSLQRVRTLYYLPYTTVTYSIQKVLALNKLITLYKLITLCKRYLLYATSTYTTLQVHTTYNEYLLNAASTYCIQQILTIYNKYIL